MSDSAAPAPLQVFICRKFSGREGGRVAAVIVARDAERAGELLNERLKSIGLNGDASSADCWLLSPYHELTLVLADGSY